MLEILVDSISNFPNYDFQNSPKKSRLEHPNLYIF